MKPEIYLTTYLTGIVVAGPSSLQALKLFAILDPQVNNDEKVRL